MSRSLSAFSAAACRFEDDEGRPDERSRLLPLLLLLLLLLPSSRLLLLRPLMLPPLLLPLAEGGAERIATGEGLSLSSSWYAKK